MQLRNVECGQDKSLQALKVLEIVLGMYPSLLIMSLAIDITLWLRAASTLCWQDSLCVPVLQEATLLEQKLGCTQTRTEGYRC